MLLRTRPLNPSGRWRLSKVGLAAGRALRMQAAPLGPQAVVASLSRGLRELGVPFVVDPTDEPQPGSVLGVLTDLAAIEEALAWRRAGLVERLVAGPNLVVLPGDGGGVIAAPEVDLCLLPSEWVRRLFEEEEPALAGRTAIWSAGVDTRYWAPGDTSASDGPPRALLYVKRLRGQPFLEPEELESMRDVLQTAGCLVHELTYGRASRDDYRTALRGSDVVVFITPTETQGLAQAEAWATDVPTLVWRGGRMRVGNRSFTTSSSPYLTDATGRWFANADELAGLLERLPEIRSMVSPRNWVLQHMTDAVSAQRYLDLAQVGVSEAKPS